MLLQCCLLERFHLLPIAQKSSQKDNDVTPSKVEDWGRLKQGTAA